MLRIIVLVLLIATWNTDAVAKLVRISNTTAVHLHLAFPSPVSGIVRFYFHPNRSPGQKELLATRQGSRGGICISEHKHRADVTECTYEAASAVATLTLLDVGVPATRGYFTGSAGRQTTEHVRLFLYNPPEVTPISQTVQVLESSGSPESNSKILTLRCQASSTSVPEGDRLPIVYSWSRSGEELSGNWVSRHDADAGQLTISPAYRGDCTAGIACIARETGAASTVISQNHLECSETTLDQLPLSPGDSDGTDVVPHNSSTPLLSTTTPNIQTTESGAGTDEPDEGNGTVVAIATVGVIVFLVGIVNLVVCLIWKKRKLEEQRAKAKENNTPVRDSKAYELEPDVSKLSKKSHKFKLRPRGHAAPPLPSLPRSASLIVPPDSMPQDARDKIYLDILSSMEVSQAKARAAALNQEDYQVPMLGTPLVNRYQDIKNADRYSQQVPPEGGVEDGSVLQPESGDSATYIQPGKKECGGQAVGEHTHGSGKDMDEKAEKAADRIGSIGGIYLITDSDKFAERDLEYVNGRLRRLVAHEADCEYITTVAATMRRAGMSINLDRVSTEIRDLVEAKTTNGQNETTNETA